MNTSQYEMILSLQRSFGTPALSKHIFQKRPFAVLHTSSELMKLYCRHTSRAGMSEVAGYGLGARGSVLGRSMDF